MIRYFYALCILWLLWVSVVVLVAVAVTRPIPPPLQDSRSAVPSSGVGQCTPGGPVNSVSKGSAR